MEDKSQEYSWWKDQEIVHLMSRVVKAGRMDNLRRKIDRINKAVENGADIRKINEFVEEGRFNGNNIDELIRHAK
jgi:molybdenum cofactor biosynthesis enzyme MoaA